MLPNADKMIETLPSALKRQCIDAFGAAHTCAVTQSQRAPSLNDFGITQNADGEDELFVAKPFSIPSAHRLTIVGADGNTETRRIDAVTDNIIFYTITLGERTRA